MLFLSLGVHPDEASDEEEVREEALGGDGEDAPGHDFPEVVGAGDRGEPVEGGDADPGVAGLLPEVLQVEVAHKVHGLAEDEKHQKHPVEDVGVRPEVHPVGVLVGRVEHIEGHPHPH